MIKCGDYLSRCEYTTREQADFRDEWLRNLKEGDKVANYVTNAWGGNYYEILTVKKITPTDMIRLDNKVLVDRYGINNKGYYIVPVTLKIAMAVAQREYEHRIAKAMDEFDFAKLKGYTFAEMEELITLLTKE